MRLDGERILFISPRFFEYDRVIAERLRARGAVVDVLADRPYDTPVMKGLTRLAPRLILPFADRLYLSQLKSFAPTAYDRILIINGQTVSQRFMRELRRQFPQAQFILYMWDSIENRPRVVKNFTFFDRLFSFDPQSASHYGLNLRPLFYSRSAPPADLANVRYDLTFIGTIHSDRYAVINRLIGQLGSELRIYRYMYLQARWVYWMQRAMTPGMREANAREFEYLSLPKNQLERVTEDSLALLDIEHPDQRGLTMRTLETVGMNRKIVTTNEQIRDYDFFDPHNVAIIDRKKPVIGSDFFRSPYKPVPTDVYYRYSLEGWIDEVLF